jgi:hypothetical protein
MVCAVNSPHDKIKFCVGSKLSMLNCAQQIIKSSVDERVIQTSDTVSIGLEIEIRGSNLSNT